MRNIFLLFLFICITGSGWAQLLYPEVMEPRTPLNGPVVNKLTGLSFPPFLYKVRQENRTIENPGVRYAIQNLKKERYPEPQVNEAINTLIRYAEDERLKHVVPGGIYTHYCLWFAYMIAFMVIGIKFLCYSQNIFVLSFLPTLKDLYAFYPFIVSIIGDFICAFILIYNLKQRN